MDKLKFSQNELLEMESLEIRGGASANAMAQGACVNEAAGCGAGVDQSNCTNKATGCGSTVVVIKPTIP